MALFKSYFKFQTMLRATRIGLTMFALGGLIVAAHANSVVGDFNGTGSQPAAGNPFVYGTETSLNTGFALLPHFGTTNCTVRGGTCSGSGMVANYYFSENFSGPTVAKDVSGSALTFPSSPPLTVPTNVIVMAPGSSGLSSPDLVVTRFIAPSSGVFNINGSFTDLQQASVSLAVVVNGTVKFSSSFAGTTASQGTIPFAISNVSLAAGATVDFVVDSLGEQKDDVIGLVATIVGLQALGLQVDYFDTGKAPFTVWRPSDGGWYATNGAGAPPLVTQWGAATDLPVVGDFDGDGITDIAVYRPSTGYWYIVDSSNKAVVARQWGTSADIPVAGDFDGDGKTDIAVFRPSNGYWYISQSSNGDTVSEQWGAGTDVPVVGDFDGDGKSDIAVWRPSSGTWYIVQSSNGSIATYQWGQSGDIPMHGDFDGDGKTDIAVYRPSTGYWHIVQSSNGKVVATQWGQSGDIPVARDYDGDGNTDIAVYRPSTGYWYVIQSSNRAVISQQWGVSTDIPVNGLSR